MMKDGTRPIAARQRFSAGNYRFDNNNCLAGPLRKIRSLAPPEKRLADENSSIPNSLS
jgi:hypothetical protein